jgi:hypothetical protein
VVVIAHPPKPPVQGDLRVESLIRGSGDWLAILDSFLVLKKINRQRLDERTEEIHSAFIHWKARRGRTADAGTFTMRVEQDDTSDVAFCFSFVSGGNTEVHRAAVAVEDLAAFMRERGRAIREDWLAYFKGRYSDRQLAPAHSALVGQGLLTKAGKGGPTGRAQIWAWVERPDGTPTDGVDTGVDDQGAFDDLSFPTED